MRLLGHVYKYDPLEHVQMWNMSNKWLVLFQWLNMFGSSNCIRQIRHISQSSQKNFGKPRLSTSQKLLFCNVVEVGGRCTPTTCLNNGACTTINGNAKCDCTLSSPRAKGEFCQSSTFWKMASIFYSLYFLTFAVQLCIFYSVRHRTEIYLQISIYSKKACPSRIFTACRPDLDTSWECFMHGSSELSCWNFYNRSQQTF